MISKNIQRLLIYYFYLLIVWGTFRFFVRLPEVFEELWFKPLIWLVPLFWWRFSLRFDLSLFEGTWVRGSVIGLLGGAIYLLVLIGIVGIPLTFSWNKLGIAASVAIVEELTFAGVILSLWLHETKREGLALGLTALMFALVHLPIQIFVFRLSGNVLVGAFLLSFFVCLVNGWLRLRSNNVLSAVLAHLVYLMIVLV